MTSSPPTPRFPCPVTGLVLAPEAWAWLPPTGVPYTGRHQPAYPAFRCAACPGWHVLLDVTQEHLTSSP